jgi:hypothetical protein
MCSSAGQLLIQGLAVGDAPSNELWPRRDGEVRVNVFGQGCPQVRMMPTQVVPRAVAMATYRGAQLDHFGAQLLSRHSVYVFVHGTSVLLRSAPAPHEDPGLVPATVARALGLPDQPGLWVTGSGC